MLVRLKSKLISQITDLTVFVFASFYTNWGDLFYNINSNTDFINVFMRIVIFFFLGVAVSQVLHFWIRYKYLKRIKSYDTRAIYPALFSSPFVFGFIISLFVIIESHYFMSFSSLLLGSVFGYFLHMESFLENHDFKSDKKSEVLIRNQFDHTLSEFLPFLLLYFLVVIPSTIFFNSIVVGEYSQAIIFLLATVLVSLFLKEVNVRLFSKFEMERENNLPTSTVLIIISVCSVLSFVFWDHIAYRYIVSTDLPLVLKLLVIVFFGFVPIRLISVLLTVKSKGESFISILLLVFYTLKKVEIL